MNRQPVRSTAPTPALLCCLALAAAAVACERVDVEEILGQVEPGGSPPPAEAVRVPFRLFSDDVGARAAKETRVLIKTAEDYRAYFGHAPPAGVDLPKEWVIFYAAGSKPTGGYTALVDSVARVPGERGLQIVTQLVSPGKGCAVTQAFTTPYVLAEIPAQDGAAAHFLRNDVARDCDAAPSSCAAVLCKAGTRCVELRSDPPQAKCVPEEPVRDPCATVKCASGTHCVAEQIQCVKAPCPPQVKCVPNEPPTEDPCSLVRCAAGTHCEAKQVQCVRAPCPPVAQCVPDAAPVACGGFAGLRCPGAGSCVDDPTDSCEPGRGGADCGGICKCNALGKCVEGSVWDSSPGVCGCVPAKEPPPPPKGEACGKNTCKAGEFCCNASCGVCAPKGGACTQQACL